MKLLLCRKCQDVIRLKAYTRSCECGNTSGHYTDAVNAVYSGRYAVPVGFANSTLVSAIQRQPKQAGLGERFDAFVIPVRCSTFQKVKRLASVAREPLPKHLPLLSSSL